MTKILHTADWHIGTFKGPEENGVNLRALDTKRCLDALFEKALEERPELLLVAGDIFHTGKTWSDRCCDEVITAINIIEKLSAVANQVIIMRGTPNHDGEGQFRLLQAHFVDTENVHIVTSPQVIQTEYADVAALPGFDKGIYRAQKPGLGKEEENEFLSVELGNIAMGLRTQCRSDRPAIFMGHYTVPGCNTESGQSQLLTQFEPIVPVEALTAANYDLVALGHIHRPQALETVSNAFYSGSINANNFNDEGQERGFWIHHFETGAFGQDGAVLTDSEFFKTPYREFLTYHWTDTDITAIIHGGIDEVAMNYWRWNGAVMGKIVRILYECSAEKHKAFNAAVVEKTLYEDGAFWVAGITPERIEAVADRTDMSEQKDPEGNLRMYLENKQFTEDVIERLLLKARPIIEEALASDTGGAFSGEFVPLEIEVKNYRAYAEERFSFEDIEFCTINGQNGAGKSSLFMDAIIDCLFEEPREGKSTSVKVPWLRNEDSVRSGYIAFTFAIGDSTYRVVRTRAKSGKGTLNLAELVGGEWQDRSQEKFNDTQADIERIIGVDSLTFRSCAIIMQDQYGLFLQARKEDRMVILGNLLGLGIYGAMEDIAKDLAVEKNRIIASKKQSVKVQAENIIAAGKPVEELEEANRELKDIDRQLRKKNQEKEDTAVDLAGKREAQARRQKLLEGISILSNKKCAVGENREAEQQIIMACNGVLSGEEEIKNKAGRFRELEEKEKTLIEEAALYNAKNAEAKSVEAELASVSSEIERYNQAVESEKKKLDNQVNPEEVEKIKAKAAEYDEKKAQLDKMFLSSQEFSRLAELRDRKAYALDSKRAYFNERERTLNSEQSALERKAALLSDSGCIDLDNAKCRFLADAVEAKSILKDYPAKFRALEKERKQELEELERQLNEAETDCNNIGFSQDALAQLQGECDALKSFDEKLRNLQEAETQIALIRASIENTKSNISEAEKRLLTLKCKAQGLNEECGRHKKSYIEHENVLAEIQFLKPWIDKENQIPVFKERRDNAIRRKEEFTRQIEELESEIMEKQNQADMELNSISGIETLEEDAKRLREDIEGLTEQKNRCQIRIGSLGQKIEEIKRIQNSIEELQKEITDLSEEASEFEQLKLSFSQDGIPHQIIRTIIPKLSATANNILSEMTGGQLGVDFQTEKVLKSNNKKEIVTLDIFIEEYGKSSLPYLSKSGGEKVKASLSVILALAEIKASTAGIQFGMLFIDEPPFLDSDGIQAYCDALETIRERYPNIKVMAITHDPTMKARFPQNLDVVKTENGSKGIY